MICLSYKILVNDKIKKDHSHPHTDMKGIVVL